MKILFITAFLAVTTCFLLSKDFNISTSEISISHGFKRLHISQIEADTFNNHGMPFNFQTNWTVWFKPRESQDIRKQVSFTKPTKNSIWEFSYLNKDIDLDTSWSGLKIYDVFPAKFKPNSWYRVKFSPDPKMRDYFVFFDDVMKPKVIEREGAW